MEQVAKLKKQLTLMRVIVFILLTLCFLFFVFGYVQKHEADMLSQESSELKKMAEAAQAEAQRQRLMAGQQLQIALSERAEAMKQKGMSEDQAVKAGEKSETVDQLKKELEAQRKIAEQNQVIAKSNQARAVQMEILAKQKEAEAKKALDECLKKKQ